MPYAVFEYVDLRGQAVVTAWLESLETRTRAKVVARIASLRLHGGELPTGMLSDTSDPLIKKIRCTGRTNPRLLLCRGPIAMHAEFTLLCGCFEKDNQMPAGVVARAAEMRLEVIADAAQRRRPYGTS